MIGKPFKLYRQLDSMDCGPACLKMILKHHGKHISLDKLKKASEQGKGGVSLVNLSLAAEKYGLHTISARLTFEELLKDAPLPCILHWNQYHYVVLTPSVNNKKVKIADPAKGFLTLTKSEFLANWISVRQNEQKKGVALLLKPGPSFGEIEDEKGKQVGWGSLSKYLFRFKRQLFQLGIGLFIGSLIQLILPYLTQNIVDSGITMENLHFIEIILLAQFGLFFSRTIVEFIRSRILLFISAHINLSIVSDFWIKLTRLPINFFDTKRIGDIFQRINDHSRIETFITGTAIQTLFSLFNLIIFSIVLLLYDPNIFYIFSLGSLLYWLWIRLFLKYRRTLDYKRFSVASKEKAAAMQLIRGMQEIKLNNAEHLKRWEWENIQASLFKLSFKSLSLNQYQQAGAFFLNESKNILITYVVAKSVLEGHLTLGVMLAIQYIVGQLNSPVEQLVNFTQRAQDAVISLERLNEIHQLEDEEPAGVPFINRISENKTIAFSNLSFSYPGSDDLVLKNINVTFPSGKVTAIVGTSGSGKTTILKLIQKFYESYNGEIKISEINLKNISPYYWRSVSGSVMQDGYIFSDSIEKNIAIGDEDPSYDRLIDSCRAANILDYIESLPLGFNTQIGEEGKGLSAGQRQRILIARVIYKAPSFILFDEATNALDANNEKAILENLLEFFKGKTVIVVAHRLSTVKNADKIVVLESGEIIEEGTHDELLSKMGKYYQLIKNQLTVGQN